MSVWHYWRAGVTQPPATASGKVSTEWDRHFPPQMSPQPVSAVEELSLNCWRCATLAWEDREAHLSASQSLCYFKWVSLSFSALWYKTCPFWWAGAMSLANCHSLACTLSEVRHSILHALSFTSYRFMVLALSFKFFSYFQISKRCSTAFIPHTTCHSEKLQQPN